MGKLRLDRCIVAEVWAGVGFSN